MPLPVSPPLEPMLARLARTLPEGPYAFEPKWDGFRCLAFRDGETLDLRSRHDRPLTRYFPEVADAMRRLPTPRFVLDGELVLAATGSDGTADFAALMSRLHPAASRVERLRRERPATYVAFDLLAVGDEDLRAAAFATRRARLEDVVRTDDRAIALTPLTTDATLAATWFEQAYGGGVDGIVAKPLDGRYEPGRRAMVKVKHTRTADCVLAGFRTIEGLRAVSSLLLGLYDDAGDLRHVGVVTQLPREQRRELVDELRPLEIPLEDHPWCDGFHIGRSPLGRLKGSAARWTPAMPLDWVPVRPERVVEVAFDQVDVDRFRHPARFVRWRPDRAARSCRLDQLAPQGSPLLAAVAP